MDAGPIEIHRPRDVTDLGLWQAGPLQLKAYGLVAEGQAIGEAMTSAATEFFEEEVLDSVAAMGDSNGLGFIIVHPGSEGLTIAVHWWALGSVLCQHIHRQPYGASRPINTVNRPAVACVWELAIINAEQEAWRETMMTPPADPAAYLAARPSFSAV